MHVCVYVCVGVCMCLCVCMCAQLAFHLTPIPQNLCAIRTERQVNGYKMGLIGQEGKSLRGIDVPVLFRSLPLCSPGNWRDSVGVTAAFQFYKLRFAGSLPRLPTPSRTSEWVPDGT